MAKYVVPPKEIIVMCYGCRTMYVPDREKDLFTYEGRFAGFEPCPVCGRNCNGFDRTIPLWRYNLIKFFRGGFRKENGH